MGFIEFGFLFVFLTGGFNENIIQVHGNPPRIEWHSEYLKRGAEDYTTNE